MKIGYARVSTEEQNLDLQLHALRAAGCGQVFEDQGVSGSSSHRAGLKEALAALHTGDVLVVWKLDRLGRSLRHLLDILSGLQERGVAFQSLQEQIDTTSAGGRFYMHILAALAEFEREMIRDRTKAGMAAARGRGVRIGRPSKLGIAQLEEARRLIAEGMTRVEVAAAFKVSALTLRRALGATTDTATSNTGPVTG